VGVVGPVPAVIGHLQALEVLKLVSGFGEVLNGTLVMYDARTCTFHRFKVRQISNIIARLIQSVREIVLLTSWLGFVSPSFHLHFFFYVAFFLGQLLIILYLFLVNCAPPRLRYMWKFSFYH